MYRTAVQQVWTAVNILPVSVISQSVSSSRARGWAAEESRMKTFPLDLTALKKVNQRLGRSCFPLQNKGISRVYTYDVSQ